MWSANARRGEASPGSPTGKVTEVRISLACALLAAVFVASVTGCRSPVPEVAPPVKTPKNTPSPSGRKYRYEVYVVQRGDTLYSIALRFGVPVGKIKAANDCSAHLKPDQALLIPLHESKLRPVWRGGAASASVGSQDALLTDLLCASDIRNTPGSRFCRPTRGNVGRRYGAKVRGLAEPGVGMRAPAGTSVHAVADGKVIVNLNRTASARGWGNVVAVRHSSGFVSWYAHLGSITVSEGQRVKKGEMIGTVGSSGAAASPVLAFRLFRNERPVDPLRHLP